MPPHGIYVAEGVGGGNGPELKGVVGNGREEIHRQDEGRLIVDAVNGGVIARLGAHQQVRVGKLGKLAQDLYQVLQRNLGGSTGAVGKLGETDFAASHGGLLER